MKMKLSKFIFGVAGILIAVFVYWMVWRSIWGRRERFENLASAKTEVAPASDKPKTREQLQYLFEKDKLPSLVLDSGRIERPYLTNPINSLDDYEYNLVFQNEGSRELSQETKNALTSAYPFDWSGLPPSAAEFQAGKSEMNTITPPLSVIPSDTYKAIEAASLQPPDMDAVEEEERKILATYVPKHAGDLKTYNIEDAKELIHKIYDAKGLKPEIVEKENNVYQVVYTTPKDPKIEYEDDPGPIGGQMYSNPRAFDVISVPGAAADTSAALDPFYEPRNSVRTTRNDYTRWTPGLERQFAPTYEKRNWY